MAKGSVQIVVERCKACGFCVEFCPTHVLALSSAFNAKGYHTPYMVHPEKCSGCDLCGMYCPDFAIFGFKEPQPHPSKEGLDVAPAPVKEGTEEFRPSKGSLNGAPATSEAETNQEEQDAR
jgi:2-oxoglutarate ferredoxin oxidoreductase subunit delta